MIRNFIDQRKGAAAIEYALLISLIAIASMGSIESVGSALTTTFNRMSMYLGVGMN